MDDEIAMLTLSIIGSLFCISYRQAIKEVGAQMFEFALYVFTAACVFTVIEGFVFPSLLNILEHVAYLTSSVLIGCWLYQVRYANHNQFF